jgi:hypothetical protein
MSNPPKLFRVLLEVEGLDAATAFYGHLLGIEGRKIGGGRSYFDCGPVIVGLVDVASGKRKAASAPQCLYFAVADLEPLYERARELGCLSKEDVHGEPAGKIVFRPWGERCFYAEDPFGNGLCFSDEKTLFNGR